MAKATAAYSPKYRRQMAELVPAGRAAEELAREFECSASAIRDWVRRTDRDEGLHGDHHRDDLAVLVNRNMTGWANDSSVGQVSPTCDALDRHAVWRLRRGSCLKHKVRTGLHVRFPDTRLPDTYGVTHLSREVIGLPSATT